MSPTNLVYTYLTRASAPFWQRCLRRNVRLYLALEEPGIDIRAVEAALRLIEQQMQWVLVGHTPTEEEAEAAHSIIEREQESLLNDRMELTALRHDISVAQYQLASESLVELATGCCYVAP